ncbi:MAG: hypothetical protein HFH72_16800 [Lachnospiraceae bacterium]|nr:hypothetical protein [Lachnospiraceae bacterium]
MKDFLSNSWVVSIISGIIVFLFTNTIIMLQNRRKHKKQIKEANSMVLNRIRGYVVDNGLPKKEIIEAVKASTSREYGIKYNELLNIREFCEELITDIIGNIYISNDNKVKYLNTLQEYLQENLKEDIKFHEQDSWNNNTSNNIKRTRSKKYYWKQRNIIGNSIAEIFFSIFTSISTIIAVLVYSSKKNEIILNGYDMYSVFIQVITAIVILILFFATIVFFFPLLNRAIKKKKRKKRKKYKNKFKKNK